jgi:xanthine dehydrogenase YagR molybdenum-binding subunit
MLFSEFLEFIQADKAGPNGHIQASTAEPTAVIGASLSRVDGPLKTTGSARYASDYNFPGMVYAVPVGATIASGKISNIDTSSAEKMPGVLIILHHDNFDHVYRNASGGRNSEQRPPFEDDTVYYWGQYVALAIAETFAQAQAAAAAVKIAYTPEEFSVATDLSDPMPAIGAATVETPKPSSPQRQSKSTTPTPRPPKPITQWRCTPPSPSSMVKSSPSTKALRE